MKVFPLPTLALATTVACAASAPAAVVFDFGFTDGSDIPGSGGFFDPLTPAGVANTAALLDVSGFIGGLLGHTAIVEIAVSTFTDAGDSTLASAGGFFYVTPAATGVVPNAVQEEILFGAVTPGTADGFMKINTAKPYYSGADPGGIGAAEKDLRSVFLHELTHTLGWSSAVKSDGTSGLTDAFIAADPSGGHDALDELFTIYDTLLVDTADEPLILPTEDFDFGTLPLSGVLIDGPATLAMAGGSVPTFISPFTFGPTHVLPGVGSIMEPSLSDGAIKRFYTPIEIGVLTDMGYTLVPTPSAGAMLLALAGPGLLRRRRRTV